MDSQAKPGVLRLVIPARQQRLTPRLVGAAGECP